ncbi:MAG: hypothetical protein Q8S21_06340 [Candidatus Paracaedibacteraceae bacterium]|nr:hypothetical protein [Candidatus Paracaedibacteraceae bacterium]
MISIISHGYIKKLTNIAQSSNPITDNITKKTHRKNSREEFKQEFSLTSTNKIIRNNYYSFINVFLQLDESIDEGTTLGMATINEMEKLAYRSCMTAMTLCNWYYQTDANKQEIFSDLLIVHSPPLRPNNKKYFNPLDCVKESISQLKQINNQSRIHQSSTAFEDVSYIEFAMVKVLPSYLREKYNEVFKELSTTSWRLQSEEKILLNLNNIALSAAAVTSILSSAIWGNTYVTAGVALFSALTVHYFCEMLKTIY